MIAALPSGRRSGRLSGTMKVADVDGVGNATAFMNPRGTLALVRREQIVPSVPQLPPYGLGASQSTMGSPPDTATFFSLWSAKKPIQRPSGEKNGPKAPSVPGSTRPPAGRARADKVGSRPDVPSRTPDARRPGRSPSTAGRARAASTQDPRADPSPAGGSTAVSPFGQEQDCPPYPCPGRERDRECCSRATATIAGPRRFPGTAAGGGARVLETRSWRRRGRAASGRHPSRDTAQHPHDVGRHSCRQQAPIRLALHRGEDVLDGLAMKRRPAGERLVQHAAEGPDIGALVQRLPARLFRAHVGRGPEHRPVLRSGPGSRCPPGDGTADRRRRRAPSPGRSPES